VEEVDDRIPLVREVVVIEREENIDSGPTVLPAGDLAGAETKIDQAVLAVQTPGCTHGQPVAVAEIQPSGGEGRGRDVGSGGETERGRRGRGESGAEHVAACAGSV
jgi:hypothetical protein